MPDLRSDWLEGTHLEGAASTEARRFHLLTYLVSNAIAAEVLSVENWAEAVHVQPTTRAKIEMVGAAQVAGEHVLVLGSLGRKLGIGVGRTMVEPCWHDVRRHVRTAIAARDLAACLILQDLIVGSAVIEIYGTLASAGDLDPRAATVAGNILADAFERREAGTWQLRTVLSQDPEGATDALRWAHHRAMPALLGATNQGCAELCADGACDATGIDYIGRDIEVLKRRSAERYTETLRALFSPAVVRPLLAGLAGYGGGAAQAGHSD